MHKNSRESGGISPENYHSGIKIESILKHLASRHAGPYSYIAAIKWVYKLFSDNH